MMYTDQRRLIFYPFLLLKRLDEKKKKDPDEISNSANEIHAGPN